jgi:membrane protease subunit HflC
VSSEVKDAMQQILTDYRTGVRLVTVELQDVTPPDPVKPAFNEVNEARQDRERRINEAQQQANREIPKARGEASGSDLVELVRSASWQAPEREVLEQATEEQEETLKKRIKRGREEITRAVLAAASEITPQYGIELVDVRVKRMNYVESVREKVYARMVSERQRIAARFRSEGEGRSAEILGEMGKELREIRSTAYRRAQEIRGKADATATRVYGAAYGRDPEFYAFSRTLETYRESRNDNSVLVLTTGSDYYRYLKDAAIPPLRAPTR